MAKKPADISIYDEGKITIEETALYLDMTCGDVELLIRQNLLPHVTVRGRVMVPKDWLAAFLQNFGAQALKKHIAIIMAKHFQEIAEVGGDSHTIRLPAIGSFRVTFLLFQLGLEE